jgi:hypothetical protein
MHSKSVETSPETDQVDSKTVPTSSQSAFQPCSTQIPNASQTHPKQSTVRSATQTTCPAFPGINPPKVCSAEGPGSVAVTCTGDDPSSRMDRGHTQTPNPTKLVLLIKTSNHPEAHHSSYRNPKPLCSRPTRITIGSKAPHHEPKY